MKPVATMKVERESWDQWKVSGYGYSNGLCADGLHRFLDEIGFDSKEIFTHQIFWISLHKHPSSNRTRVEVIQENENEPGWMYLDFGTPDDLSSFNSKIDRILKPFLGKKLWVQIEYEL